MLLKGLDRNTVEQGNINSRLYYLVFIDTLCSLASLLLSSTSTCNRKKELMKLKAHAHGSWLMTHERVQEVYVRSTGTENCSLRTAYVRTVLSVYVHAVNIHIFFFSGKELGECRCDVRQTTSRNFSNAPPN